MQQIIDLKAKLAEGESKKYSLLRIATRLRVAEGYRGLPGR